MLVSPSMAATATTVEILISIGLRTWVLDIRNQG
jgi:hypothetical protein